MYVPSTNELESVNTNPPVGVQEYLSSNGTKWLWAVTAVYALTLGCFMAWDLISKNKKKGSGYGGHHTGVGAGTGMGTGAYEESTAGAHVGGVGVEAGVHHDSLRKYKIIATMGLTIGSFAYYLMASNLGYTGIRAEFSHHTPAGTIRQFWYVRWVYYILCMPLMSLLFTLHGRARLSNVVLTAFMNAAWPAALLIGALIRTSYKWGAFVFAAIFYLYMMYLLAVPCRRVNSIGYWSGLGAFSLFGILYFIAWGCCEGGNVVGVTGEMIWYGILDILFKPFFLIYYFLVVFTLHKRHRDDHHHAGTGMAGTTVGTGVTGTAAGTQGSPRAGKKMFSRRGQHDAPLTEKPAHTGMATGTGPMGTGTGATGTTDTNIGHGTGTMGTGTGTGVGHTDHAHGTGLGHTGGMREANPRLSEQTAVSDNRF